MNGHEWSIDPAQYERHEQRRGRRHAFETLTPSQTALVVVDLVPFFVDANPLASGVIENVNALAATLRRAGGVVAWVVPSTAKLLPARVEFFGPEVAEAYRRSGGEGSLRERLASGLDRSDHDLFIEKTTPSAFFPGGSTLDVDLANREVGTVLVVGAVANVCVESSARDASTLGYRTIVVADAVLSMREAELNATLHTVYRSFGDVRSTAEVLDLISSSE